MKKQVKIPLIVTSSVVGAILVAVIVLCCITIKPLQEFRDYDWVEVYTQDGEIPSGALGETYKDTLNKNLDKTNFSVMRATLELAGSYGPKFVTTEDEDGNVVHKELTIAAARNEAAATDSSYKLEFCFEKERTLTVEKETIAFDRAMMNVHTTDGELKWVTLYLYRSAMDGVVGYYEAEEYRVTPIRMRMNTSPLYIALGEIAADYR